MKLLDQNGWKAEIWTRASGVGLPAEASLLVPFVELPRHLARNGALGVEILNTVRLTELEAHLDRLSLIAIAFPSFSDGRGFSIAKSLRHAGYRGYLRAVGPLIADQFAYALACGFDEVELPDDVAARQPVAHWLAAARAFRATYQRNHRVGGLNILDQRRAARVRS